MQENIPENIEFKIPVSSFLLTADKVVSVDKWLYHYKFQRWNATVGMLL